MDSSDAFAQWIGIVRHTVDKEIVPRANEFAHNEKVPMNIIKELFKLRCIGSLIHKEYGGHALDYTMYGLLNRTIGYGCSSIRSLLTVHDMVAFAIQHFGTSKQKQTWLPQLVTGEVIAAFALSEPQGGSNIQLINTKVNKNTVGKFYMSGRKKWISFGQIADLFLVFAMLDDQPVTVILPKKYCNFIVKPIQGMLGTSAAMLAEISFNKLEIDESWIVGQIGSAFSFVANQCLTLGRFSVSNGCVGLMEACIYLCKKQVLEVRSDGSQLIQHQLISRLLANMIVDYKAGLLLCDAAGRALNDNFNDAIVNVMIAKYQSAKAASRVANDAIQIFGAQGHSDHSALRRFLHDAKVAEIIEGSNEIMQTLIPKIYLPRML